MAKTAKETVIEIDTKSKYILIVDEPMPQSTLLRMQRRLAKWIKSDEPFLIIDGSHIKLVKKE